MRDHNVRIVASATSARVKLRQHGARQVMAARAQRTVEWIFACRMRFPGLPFWSRW